MRTAKRDATSRRQQFGLLACLLLGLVLVASAAGAQQPAPAKKPDPKAQQPQAAAKPAQPQPEQDAWVKLCEKIGFVGKDKDGKEQKQEKSICLTHHERLDGATGMVMVSAAFRQIEGAPKAHFMVMVPLGMAIPPGLHAKIFSPPDWEKARADEKMDLSKMPGQGMPFMLCHPAGCTAEVEATPELVGKLKNGGGLVVFAVNAAGQRLPFVISLKGFGKALDGAPIDNELYSKERKRVMDEIRKRQAEYIEQYKKQQEDEKAKADKAFKGLPAGEQAPAQPPPGQPKKK